jgi:hypothetical protein
VPAVTIILWVLAVVLYIPGVMLTTVPVVTSRGVWSTTRVAVIVVGRSFHFMWKLVAL